MQKFLPNEQKINQLTCEQMQLWLPHCECSLSRPEKKQNKKKQQCYKI